MHRHHDARPGAGARLRSSPHSTRVGVVTLDVVTVQQPSVGDVAVGLCGGGWP